MRFIPWPPMLLRDNVHSVGVLDNPRVNLLSVDSPTLAELALPARIKNGGLEQFGYTY